MPGVHFHSKDEGVDPTVSADIQATFRRYQRLEVAEPTHRLAGKNWLTGVTAESMKPIITFSTEYPYDGIGMTNCQSRELVITRVVVRFWSERRKPRFRPTA